VAKLFAHFHPESRSPGEATCLHFFGVMLCAMEQISYFPQLYKLAVDTAPFKCTKTLKITFFLTQEETGVRSYRALSARTKGFTLV
jgi:hypothetical protein